MAESDMNKTKAYNRFQDFFESGHYVAVKNDLYNYRLRQRAVANALEEEKIETLLEIGSGMSPIVTDRPRVLYSDLSFTAMRTLKSIQPSGWYVVADGTQMPFTDQAFSHAVISEVLEHIENDEAVVRELARVLKPKGRVVVTFPHRRFYYTNDDRYVEHVRRYELEDMESRLARAGFTTLLVRKVLGPLEKLTMSTVVAGISFAERVRGPAKNGGGLSWWVSALRRPFKWANQLYMPLVRLDARVMPQSLAAVLLIKAEKR